jgi:predicted RNase H-like HicB family nuclease
MNALYSAVVFKEGEQFVAYSPQFDLSSCGETTDEARRMLKEAVFLFLEETDKMGKAEEVLQDMGFTLKGTVWTPPPVVEISLEEVA